MHYKTNVKLLRPFLTNSYSCWITTHKRPEILQTPTNNKSWGVKQHSNYNNFPELLLTVSTKSKRLLSFKTRPCDVLQRSSRPFVCCWFHFKVNERLNIIAWPCLYVCFHISIGNSPVCCRGHLTRRTFESVCSCCLWAKRAKQLTRRVTSFSFVY